MNTTSTIPADVNDETQPLPRRRWVKVDVDETTFLTMHDCANKSRMRVSMYLRTLLNDANVYHQSEGVPFESPSVSTRSS